MLTEQRLNDAINNLIARFNGQHIGFPDGNYHGECTAPIVWLNQDLGIPVPPMWPYGANARADGWGVSFPGELAPYFNHEHYQAGKAYPRGSIMLWNSPHIAIVLHSDGSNIVQVFEQNADPNGAPCQTTNRVVTDSYHQCTYVLTPMLQAPAPAGPPFDIRPVDPYKRDVLEGHQKWNLDQPDFKAVAASPILTLNQRTTITVAAELHHHAIPQYIYLLEDPSVPQGYNQLDTEAYIPPPPPSSIKDYSPVPFPAAEQYELVTDVPTYQTPTNAQNKRPDDGNRLHPGKYYVYANDSGMKELTLVNGKPSGLWINPMQNELPEVVKIEVKPLPQPVPAPDPQPTDITPWFNKVEWFNEQHLPVIYLTTKDTTIRDYSGIRPEVYPLELGHELKVYGTITDGAHTKYYLSKLPKADAEFQYRYAVPMVDPETGRALLLKKATKPVRNRDHVSVIASELEEMGLQFIDFIPRSWKRLETKIIRKG